MELKHRLTDLMTLAENCVRLEWAILNGNEERIN